MFLFRISVKEEAGKRFFFFFRYLLFPIACFLYTLLPSPRDTLELLGKAKHQILFNFDTHKGLPVKISNILVCQEPIQMDVYTAATDFTLI